MNRETLRSQLAVFVRVAGVKSRGWLVWAVLGSVGLAIFDLAGVAAMAPLMSLFSGANPEEGALGVISRLLGTTDAAVLTVSIASFVVLVFILKSACTIPFRWWLVGRTTQISADASAELFRKYVLSPYEVHRKRRIPEIQRNIGEATVQSSTVLLGVVTMASDILVLGGILIVLIIASPLVTAFVVVFFGVLIAGIQGILRKRQRQIGEAIAEAALQSRQYLLSAFDGFREVRLASNAPRFYGGYHDARTRSAQAQRNLSTVSELPKYLLEIGFILAIAGIAALLFATESQASALTTLAMFAAASLRALPTLNRVSASFATIRSGQAGLRIFAEAVREIEVHETHGEQARETDFDGDIVFDHVSYAYPDADLAVVDDISLTIPQKSTIAFVGSSGAGKSTLLDLLLGLLRPDAGVVRAAGRSIHEDLVSWYGTLGVVPQEVFLLNDTVEANVAFGFERIDDERVVEALRQAELSDFVATLPEGTKTIVGERGTRLSGGQRQRLGLARALYRSPQVLVLDEATSALDNETEHQIARTLTRLGGTMTVIIVAHRLSTVRRADRIFYLEGGRVRAEGTFDEVREASAAFARLAELGSLT